MKVVAIDTETHLIEPGVFTPKCVSVAFHSDKRAELLLAGPGALRVEELLDLGYTLVFANPGFDIATLCRERRELFPMFVTALTEGRIWCVQVAQKLIDIEAGCRKFSKYGLGVLTERFFGVGLDKTDGSWRLRYEELDGVPVDAWPEEARDYAEKDARYTWGLYKGQVAKVDPVQLADRVRFDVALYWMSREGMGVAEAPILKLEKETLAAIAKLEPEMIAEGLLQNRNKESGLVNLFTGEVSEPDWGKDPQALQDRVFHSGRVSVTDKGNVCTDGAALLETGDPLLLRYAEYSKHLATRNKDLVFLREGLKNGRIHTRFDSLLDTGRTSSSRPNLQNLSRTPGVRECFVPPDGKVFIVADYASAELHTLAQTCLALFGESQLADVLNSGLDPHIMMAQRLADVGSYEEMAAHAELKHFRQIAKPVSFGLPGGMGPDGLTVYARSMGVDLAEVGFEAPALIRMWKETWPEMAAYFAWVKRQLPTVSLPCGSRRTRHTDFFTEAANYCFQGLAADGAAFAAWDIFVACYWDWQSPLFGCVPVMFVHDEFILEAPRDIAEDALPELCRVMEVAFNKVVPDVPVHAEGEIKARWTK